MLEDAILMSVRRPLDEANRLMNLRNFEAAFQEVEKAIQAARSQEHVASLAAAYYGKAAVIWSSGGSAEEAHRYASLAAQNSRPNSETDLMLRTLIARIKAARQNYEAAILICEDLLRYYKQEDRLAGQADILRSLGDIYMQQGQYDRAREQYMLSLALYESLDDPLNHAGLLLSLGSLMYQTDDPDKARDYWEQARGIAEASGFRHIVERVNEAMSELF
jgi:tetratricopeptide (TPR) repeat protein